MSRFFIALLPPKDIQDYANQIKQYFADNYASRGAQKSPPHITLQPPFEWADANVSLLEVSLKEFVSEQKSVPITLSGFAAFPPRVIYIDVVRTQELFTLQADLMAYVENKLGIIDKVAQTRPFAPHMTVAFRDLTKQNFKAAWPEFEKRQLYFDFTADKLTLLLHDGKRWNLKSEFSFFSAG
ncbi:2'-5' RNA ligase family protein [Nostoc sp. PA-18-2419]|uniref:2'-5' RNA ligase family protein n=1 Tax=Nostoc sp. PA-18-2419 TaxID=2575443 RepID=UPI00110963F0|nr:2'-5' RNA ligase family protein [Nostoc sp. PA-18-2419]